MGQDGEEKEERKDGDKAQKSRGQKVRERWATKESGLYKKKTTWGRTTQILCSGVQGKRVGKRVGYSGSPCNR